MRSASDERARWNIRSAVGAASSRLRRTPLLAAAAFGHVEVVRLLVRAGADSTLANARGPPIDQICKAQSADKANEAEIKAILLSAGSVDESVFGDPEAHILDVRTPSETAAGVIKGALLIPMDEIEVRKKQELSVMPEGVALGLSSQELADLLAFLTAPAQREPSAA